MLDPSYEPNRCQLVLNILNITVSKAPQCIPHEKLLAARSYQPWDRAGEREQQLRNSVLSDAELYPTRQYKIHSEQLIGRHAPQTCVRELLGTIPPPPPEPSCPHCAWATYLLSTTLPLINVQESEFPLPGFFQLFPLALEARSLATHTVQLSLAPGNGQHP